MKIAHLLPASATFPLKKHNGRYEWVLRLARLQLGRGHDVTIFAGKGSTDTSSITWKTLEQLSDDKKTTNLRLLTMAFEDDSYDVYHSHFDYLHYLVADTTTKPVIATQHWYPYLEIAEAVKQNTHNNVITVPVTQRMQDEDLKLNIPSTHFIYHGVDLSLFKPSAEVSDRFVFAGRIHPEKGVDIAIKLAKETGIQLDIIGKVNNGEQIFWESLAPLIDGDQIRYLGPQTQAEVAQTFATAKAFLFPSQRPEAFGQVTIEAQAAGTPVIISDIGPSNELVQNSITGYVCSVHKDYLEAISNITDIDRTACRTFAEKFNIETMVSNYDQLYERTVESFSSTSLS